MIICAALKVTDYEVPASFQETVVPCWRHCNGYSILNRLCPEKMLYNGAIEGFMDHNGKFLTREEAYDHALKCGQIPAELRQIKAQRNENMLFSEDLY